LNNFCVVCCDHIQLRYRNIANKFDLGNKLKLSLYGFSKIQTAVSQEEINSCRMACKKQYKVEMPIVLPSPPRDPMLGKETNNPGISCMDIKRWGDENAKSGQYWIELSKKGLQKVYCDMETDNGGWTLFYNYKHMPSQEITLDSTVNKDLYIHFFFKSLKNKVIAFLLIIYFSVSRQVYQKTLI